MAKDPVHPKGDVLIREDKFIRAKDGTHSRPIPGQMYFDGPHNLAHRRGTFGGKAHDLRSCNTNDKHRFGHGAYRLGGVHGGHNPHKQPQDKGHGTHQMGFDSGGRYKMTKGPVDHHAHRGAQHGKGKSASHGAKPLRKNMAGQRNKT